MLRCDFEKLDEIKKRMKRSNISFKKSLNKYYTPSMGSTEESDLDFIQGGWYAVSNLCKGKQNEH